MKYKEQIETLFGVSNKENNDESPQNSKDPLLELLSVDDLLFTNYSSLEKLKESQKLNEKIYRCLIKGFLELLIPSKETILEDKERKVAKSKVNLIYGSNEIEERIKINGIINLRVPLTRELQNDNGSLMKIEFYNGEEYKTRKKNASGQFI